MTHPLAQVPRSSRPALFIVFLGATLATMLALNISGRPLITSAAPSGIVSYEFAGEVSTAGTIIDSWQGTTKIYAGFNLGLDYLYLVLYSSTIGMAIVWLTINLQAPKIIMVLAISLAWGQWLAAVLDGFENFALLTMLVGQPAEPWPQVALWCAAIKFALVFVGLLCVLIAAIAQLARRFAK